MLYPVPIHTYLLSVCHCLQVLFQQIENLLTLYDPILGLGISALHEDQVYQSGSIISIQCSEGCHTNGHVEGGVVAMLS
jgi:hypothetical protein